MRAASPATKPVPANSTAGTASHQRAAGERPDDESDAAHDRCRAEPLLRVQATTVGLVDQRPDRGDEHSDPEREAAEDRRRPRRPLRDAAPAPSHRDRPPVPWRARASTSVALGCHSATASPASRASTARRSVEEGEPVGQEDRQAEHEQRPAGDASPPLARRLADDEGEPHRRVDEQTDAADERQQDEGDADPQGVDAEAGGEQRGDTAEDGLRGAQLVRRRVEHRSLSAGGGARSTSPTVRMRAGAAPSGITLIDP